MSFKDALKRAAVIGAAAGTLIGGEAKADEQTAEQTPDARMEQRTDAQQYRDGSFGDRKEKDWNEIKELREKGRKAWREVTSNHPIMGALAQNMMIGAVEDVLCLVKDHPEEKENKELMEAYNYLSEGLTGTSIEELARAAEQIPNRNLSYFLGAMAELRAAGASDGTVPSAVVEKYKNFHKPTLKRHHFKIGRGR